jgi:hypothetical protein
VTDTGLYGPTVLRVIKQTEVALVILLAEGDSDVQNRKPKMTCA